jgi:hypothetical protein
MAEVPPESEPWSADTGYLLYRPARLATGYGRLAEAEPMFRRALAGFEATLGATVPP